MFCPLCSGSDFLDVITRNHATVSCNFLYPSQEEAKRASSGQLTIVMCRSCGFVFNSTFDLRIVPYGPGYDNDQTQSALFIQHMKQMAEKVRSTSAALCVIEVGCGQGQFLKMLLRPGDMGLGFDPSYNGGSIPGCEVRREFFGPETKCNGFSPNSVVSRHVIEHVPWPLEMVSGIRSALQEGVRVFFETPDVNWIFQNNAFWDFCYEHCSYFTPQTLAFLFEQCGFTPEKVEHVFGRQYLWIESRSSSPCRLLPAVDESAARTFSSAFVSYQKKWQRVISQRKKVAIWGAATKGTTFVQDVDPEARFIHCMIDINPKKQGRFLPITGHQVTSWEAAIAAGVELVIVANPNYLEEVKESVNSRAEIMCL